jgi:hypothetical protein
VVGVFSGGDGVVRWWEYPLCGGPCTQLHRYNIETDPGEHVDLARAMPAGASFRRVLLPKLTMHFLPKLTMHFLLKLTMHFLLKLTMHFLPKLTMHFLLKLTMHFLPKFAMRALLPFSTLSRLVHGPHLICSSILVQKLISVCAAPASGRFGM